MDLSLERIAAAAGAIDPVFLNTPQFICRGARRELFVTNRAPRRRGGHTLGRVAAIERVTADRVERGSLRRRRKAGSSKRFPAPPRWIPYSDTTRAIITTSRSSGSRSQSRRPPRPRCHARACWGARRPGRAAQPELYDGRLRAPGIAFGDGRPQAMFDPVRRVATSSFMSLNATRLFLLTNTNATGGGSACFGDSGGRRSWTSAGPTCSCRSPRSRPIRSVERWPSTTASTYPRRGPSLASSSRCRRFRHARRLNGNETH